MNSLVKIENLSFRYRGRSEYALKSINLNLDEGGFYLLIGRSGAGKTSLIRCITGLIPHFYSGEYSGEVYINGLRVSETPIYELSKHVGLVRQNPEEQILMNNVERDIAFSLEFEGMTRDEMIERVEWIMDRLGITHLRNRDVDTLSGGELQKVALANALVKKPKILILDEPSAYLSPSSVKNLVDILKSLNAEDKITILISDHRLDYWIGLINEIILIDGGELKFKGQLDDLINALELDTHGINTPLLVKLSLDLSRICRHLTRTYDVRKLEENIKRVLAN